MVHSGQEVDGREAPGTRFWQKIGLVADVSAACRRQQPDAPSFGEVLELIQGIIPFDAATLYLKEPKADAFTPRAQLAEEVPLPRFLRAPATAGGQAWRTELRRPVLWTADSDEDAFEPDRAYVVTLSVPLLIDDEVIGVLNLGSYTVGALVEGHIQLLTIVADQLAISIERLNRLAEIQAQNAALRAAHKKLKASQQRIIAAEKLAAVVDLAATINHEINNPLSVIVGQVQCLLFEDRHLSDRAVDRLRQVERAALRISEVNRRLLKVDSIVSDEPAEIGEKYTD